MFTLRLLVSVFGFALCSVYVVFVTIFHIYRIPDARRFSLNSDFLCRRGEIPCPIETTCPLRPTPRSYVIPEFASQLFHNCDGDFSLESLELWRSKSFFSEWNHEFPVLVMKRRDRLYGMFVHRAWDNAWAGQDVPPFLQGSRKLPSDRIEIYLYGSLEDRLEKADADLQIRLDVRWFPSFLIAPILLGTYETAGPYNLLGMNCWGWSRFLIYAILKNRMQYVVAASKSETVEVRDAWESFLANFWLNWALLLRLQSAYHSGRPAPEIFR
jgi:hypothetical protein